jgi:cell division protein FtsW (lipid II flippase)
VAWRVGQVWRRIEDRIFALAAEAEYRTGLAPRSTRIVPQWADRQLLRLVVAAVPFLAASWFLPERRTRGLVMLAALAVVLVLALAIFLMAPKRRRR